MNWLIVFALSVSFCILCALRLLFKNAIYATDNADKAVHLRREYSYVRYIVLILTATIILVTISSDDYHYSTFTGGFVLTWSAFWTSTSLRVSSKRPKDILTNEKFVLYLRGFSFDNYDGLRPLQKQSQFENFSEYHFISIINKYMPVYSVGMTKELEAPFGATRIYLNDEEWEKDVQELIWKAEMIIVLVNDSYSCIWEIEQCYKSDKTILIVDNKDKFISVRGYFANKHIYPFPISLNSHTILYHNAGEDYFQIPFENTKKSYKKVIKQFMKERYGIRRWIITSWQRNLLFGLLIISSFIASFIEASAKTSHAEIILHLLVGVVLLISIYFLYSVPMSKYRKFLKKGVSSNVYNRTTQIKL